MTNYKNINCSFQQLDYNYIESAYEYWLEHDRAYKNFIDFVDGELINRLDMKIIANVAKEDKNIQNAKLFVQGLKKSYLEDVKNFCVQWGLQIRKESSKRRNIAIAYIENIGAFIEVEYIDKDSTGQYIYNVTTYWESDMKKRIFNRERYTELVVDNQKSLKEFLMQDNPVYDNYTDEKMSKRDKKHIETLKNNCELVVV